MRIKLTENIGVAGQSKSAGEILTIGKDVTAEDARYIVSIQRAKYIDDDKAKKDDMEALIDLAKELGIPKPAKKSREELEALIVEKQAASKESGDDGEDDDGLATLDEQELIAMATELGIEEAHTYAKPELIDLITKAVNGDA